MKVEQIQKNTLQPRSLSYYLISFNIQQSPANLGVIWNKPVSQDWDITTQDTAGEGQWVWDKCQVFRSSFFLSSFLCLLSNPGLFVLPPLSLKMKVSFARHRKSHRELLVHSKASSSQEMVFLTQTLNFPRAPWRLLHDCGKHGSHRLNTLPKITSSAHRCRAALGWQHSHSNR